MHPQHPAALSSSGDTPLRPVVSPARVLREKFWAKNGLRPAGDTLCRPGMSPEGLWPDPLWRHVCRHVTPRGNSKTFFSESDRLPGLGGPVARQVHVLDIP
eukprot:491504-Amphidinium_carterae.1